MTLRLHHIFVCTTVGGPEAASLQAAGLVEGSSNTHPGQGSANRRFFFESGFLELFWIHDESEAQSPLAAPTRIWERWAGRAGTTSPFGICFSSDAGAAPPFPTWSYRPDYLPEGRAFLLAEGTPLTEPELFVLGWPQSRSSPASEPTTHPLGLRGLESVSIGVPDVSSASDCLRAAERDGRVGAGGRCPQRGPPALHARLARVRGRMENRRGTHERSRNGMKAKHRVYSIPFAKIYPLYVQKVERKQRTKQELDKVIRWLTGYTAAGLKKQIDQQVDLETFFAKAPAMNPRRKKITGTVCGVRVEEVEDPLMRNIRYMDKLVDELAKGRAMEKVLREEE